MAGWPGAPDPRRSADSKSVASDFIVNFMMTIAVQSSKNLDPDDQRNPLDLVALGEIRLIHQECAGGIVSINRETAHLKCRVCAWCEIVNAPELRIAIRQAIINGVESSIQSRYTDNVVRIIPQKASKT